MPRHRPRHPLVAPALVAGAWLAITCGAHAATGTIPPATAASTSRSAAIRDALDLVYRTECYFRDQEVALARQIASSDDERGDRRIATLRRSLESLTQRRRDTFRALRERYGEDTMRVLTTTVHEALRLERGAALFGEGAAAPGATDGEDAAKTDDASARGGDGAVPRLLGAEHRSIDLPDVGAKRIASEFARGGGGSSSLAIFGDATGPKKSKAAGARTSTKPGASGSKSKAASKATAAAEKQRAAAPGRARASERIQAHAKDGRSSSVKPGSRATSNSKQKSKSKSKAASRTESRAGSGSKSHVTVR